MSKKYWLLPLLLMWSWVGAAEAPRLVVVGDSLSAGYGVADGQGWVDLLARRIQEQGFPHQVVNASITGDTSQGGLTRLPALLQREQPALVIIELGGNDGLRGIAPSVMADNLRQMIAQAQAAAAQVLLIGVEIPANYGPAYRQRFHDAYYEVSQEAGVPLIPSFLQQVALQPELMQADGIHPNEKAQPVMLDVVWPLLLPLLGGSS